MGQVYNRLACCEAGPPLKRGEGSVKDFDSGQGSGHGSHSMLRGSAGEMDGEGPKMRDYVLIPWLCAIIIVLITVVSAGSSSTWVWLPALLICAFTGMEAWTMYKRQRQAQAIFFILCCLGGLAAFIVSMIAYVHFLRPYHVLGGGATYVDMLPSQSAAGAADATALLFAQGTSVDISRAYGYVDGRNPSGTIYCVAPVSNKYTIAEPGVQFFAAGINCCGKKSGFGCGEGGSGARGAMIMQSEETADPGFKKAVEGAAVQYTIQPGNGYLLLNMVPDPIQFRNDKWDSAVQLALIYIVVYLLISCMFGYMGYNMAKRV